VARPLDIPMERIDGPNGQAVDVEAECASYERRIAEAGGVDLQLLGVGRDGHIGFNEPSSSLASRTRIKTLTGRTRLDNARFFDGNARHLLLVATGSSKAEAVAAAVEGPITASVPASALQLHPHATVLVDSPAAGQLARRDYYQETFLSKPTWQGL